MPVPVPRTSSRLSFVMPRWPMRPFALILAAVLLASACGGGGGKGSPDGGQPQGSSAPGVLIFSRPDGLYSYDVKSAALSPLIKPEQANSFVLDPAVSRDGTRLAYIRQPPPKVNGTSYDAGSDLWVADRDGSNARMVFAHAQPNQLVRYPQWGADSSLYAIVQEIETQQGITSVVYTLQRFTAETDQRTQVLRDVLAYSLSPDGERVAYAKFARETGESFEALPLAGGEPVTLVAPTENLAPFNSPRYSPDGTQLAFASADQTGARGEWRYVAARGMGRPDAPGADGLPEDIWTVPAGGGRPTRVADLKEDLPALTWNGDGTRIYVIGAAGLYEVNLENGATSRIGDGSFHAQVVWTAK